MIEEHQLIPYQTSEIPPGPWLVFAPHPDDETFGMGGSIALATQQGIRVEVVVMTGGELGGDPEMRRQECLNAGRVLGIDRHHFWSIADQGIKEAEITLRDLETVIEPLQPGTIFLPGIQEFHPDHRFGTRKILNLLQKGSYQGSVWLYEISRQSEANQLVDITPVLEVKQSAIRCFSSQLALIDYEHVVMGINAGRAYTLSDPGITHAEAFWSCADLGPAQDPQISQYHALHRYWTGWGDKDRPLVSVIVRTKDRPRLLREALTSIYEQTYRPLEAVVINDGGESISLEELGHVVPDLQIRYVEHETRRGRAQAANNGIMQASGEYICFLDDDDLFYPWAIETLLFYARQDLVTYGRARCVTYGIDGTPEQENVSLLGAPMDRGRLILENYIAFNTLCMPSHMLQKAGPLDDSLEIYEDWDLLIRISRICDMHFIDVPVAEYRIFGSATVTGQGGADRQNFYRKKLLAKHMHEVSPHDILSFVQNSVDKVVLEKEKTINMLKDHLEQQSSEKSHLQEILDKKSRELHETYAMVQNLQSNLDDLRNNNTEMQVQLDAVFSSTSWRITKPLRSLKTLIRPGT